MPYLDPSIAITSPMLSDLVTVQRRKQMLTASGRVETVVRKFQNIVGVVTAASPNDLERLEDDQRMGRNMSLVTTFRLIGPAKDGSQQYQPDQIEWAGDTYVVKSVEPYTRFGVGFVQAIIGSIDSINEVLT